MNGIIREPTEQEKRDFTPVIEPRRKESVKEKFMRELSEQKIEFTKKHEPFFEKAAIDDFNDYYNQQVKLNIRKNGYLKTDEIKPFVVDFSKYGNIKNFELLEDGDVYDENLSKRYSKPVYVKKKVYKFNGYEGRTTVMEDPFESIKRAK